ncbi:hypothetical protein [Candidatus Leptofilum sp.]|uniref:hypothetical protein n=1 Tax=Candidatus Leptofilum sp. TaxID=3241576 RepID=UPI003B5A9F05
MATNSAKYLSTLHKQIDQYFSFSEVRTLCFNLGVDYENIPGDHRSAFIRNLIVSLAKQGRLQKLIDEVRAERAFVNWQDVPSDFELPASVSQEDIRQVVNYTVYGDVVHGDKVTGDRIMGDKITVGNIENAEGIAIGRDAAANVNKRAAPVERPSTIQPTPITSNLTVKEAVDRVNRYLQLASDGQKDAVAEFTNSMNLILNLAAKQPVDRLHLKLLCLGQQQLAQELGSDVPGIDQVVAQFVTAVQNQ